MSRIRLPELTLHKFSNILFLLFLCAATAHAQTGVQGAAQTREIPEWARGIVWYRIVIDRFCNGDRENDPTSVEVFGDKSPQWSVSTWTGNWHELTQAEKLNSDSFYDNAFLRQYGGDIAGIRARLGYLKSLGVNGLLLTPVFEANSSHKYDVNSYHHVDPRFGPRTDLDTAYINREKPDIPQSWIWTPADRAFLEFLHVAHDSGFKVVVDLQLAHVGVNFWAFKDVLQKQEKSQYQGWFVINEWDRPETPFISEFAYKSMWGIKAFPELRKDSLGLIPGAREYVFASVRRWMDPDADGDPSDGVDGWWIELSDALSVYFWEQWLGFVRSINPSAIVIGAPLKEAAKSRRYFDIEETDHFGRLASRWVLNRRITPTRFEAERDGARSSLSMSDADAQINMINDHETDRLASMCANRDLLYDTDNSPMRNASYRSDPPDEAARGLQKLLLVLQLTSPGSPLIYYGDEAGMWGGDDPDCRKPMLWSDSVFAREIQGCPKGEETGRPSAFDSVVHAWYGRLLQLRRDHIALRAGAMRTIVLDDERFLYGFARQAGADRVYVLINAGSSPQECRIPLGDTPEGARVDAPLHDLWFYAEKDGLQLVLPAESAVVLIPRM